MTYTKAIHGHFQQLTEKQAAMNDPDQAALQMQIARLKQEHDDYHMAIDAMLAQRCDSLAIQRMKKKKLELKDEITKRSSNVIPDIIA